jgi:hypothetical protein
MSTNQARDIFFRDMLRDISGALEDVVGLDEAEGYFAVVGALMGERIWNTYQSERTEPITRCEVPELLVDLKERIGGTFQIESQSAESVTFCNGACPFWDRVEGRQSLCMMTSNVFGFIAAEANGYARVDLEKTIAAGDGMCRVTVHFEKEAGGQGREYYAQP